VGQCYGWKLDEYGVLGLAMRRQDWMGECGVCSRQINVLNSAQVTEWLRNRTVTYHHIRICEYIPANRVNHPENKYKNLFTPFEYCAIVCS